MDACGTVSAGAMVGRVRVVTECADDVRNAPVLVS